ncbi:hypothetical protein SE19_01455 [Acidiplasma aeolicum]|uniref:Peptidase S26 domain-containing protein n=1 Tax=Acidiplasma aeolicum TaxID=507754 RepID=A0A0N8PQK1_9ARCH|nr:signal peptidase I [Acidiplasma aeolicum]KPV47349.1 hypothetical protein SE19_01455 [Acidiplasma aeolicum]
MKKTFFLIIIGYIFSYKMILHYTKNAWLAVIVPAIIFIPLIPKIKIKFNKDVIKLGILALFMEFFLIEPGLVFKKIVFHFYIIPFLTSVVYSIITAFIFILILMAIKETKIKSFLLRGLLFGSSVLLYYYPYSALINTKTIFSFAVFNIIFIFFLGITIIFIYNKSVYNFLATLLFILIFAIFASFPIIIEISKYYYLIWQMITLSLIIFLTDLMIKNSFEFLNIFRSNKINFKKLLKNSKYIIILLVVITILSIAISPGITEHSYFVIGDPTGSMYPVIKPGSVLVVGPINTKSIKVGDIIVFNAPWENGTLFAHQVIKICHIGGHEYFRTKGVANPAPDPKPVPPYDVKGRVLFAIPYLGYALIYSKLVLAVVFVGIAGILIYPGKRGSWKNTNMRW